ncbi:MAG TPA: CRISPR-associated protein Csx11 [Caldisericia bacterium]|nr:CRISPR-associated protein Csx11 [Caldisericia bacterium]
MHNKETVLYFEFASLLHDLGKLSDEFLSYRSTWQKEKEAEDPHTDKFLDKDTLITGYPILQSVLTTVCLELQISIDKCMNEHTAQDTSSKFIKLLKAADSFDSAYDRNNPFFCMEQFCENLKYRSTPYGFETVIPNLNEKRKELYENISSLLQSQDIMKLLLDYDQRNKLYGYIEDAFSCTVSDTCVPANDTSLWQHCYATAAFAKILYNHHHIYKESLDFKTVKFGFLGFSWDAFRFISKGSKVADINARYDLVKKIKSRLKEIVEIDYYLGMSIYDDEDSIVFLIPEVKSDMSAFLSYAEKLNDIKKIAITESNTISNGELLPHCTWDNESVKEEDKKQFHSTSFPMDIVHVIEFLHKIKSMPIQLKSMIYLDQHKLAWMNKWNNTIAKICEICELRPVDTSQPSSVSQEKICRTCKDRREEQFNYYKNQKNEYDINTPVHSIFSDEIADENNQLCILSIKMNIEPWLSGDMVWTLWMKEQNAIQKAIKHLGKVKNEYLAESDEERKKYFTSQPIYHDCLPTLFDIENDIDKCFHPNGKEDHVKHISFLYGRHTNKIETQQSSFKNIKDWIDELNARKKSSCAVSYSNYILTKNYTPSRLLSLWNTTRDFLKRDIPEEVLDKELPMISRFKFVIEEKHFKDNKDPKGCFDAKITIKNEITIYSSNISILIQEEHVIPLLSYHQNKEIRDILEKDNKLQVSFTQVKNENSPEPGDISVNNEIIDEKKVKPYRFLTNSPDQMLILIPASIVEEINYEIMELYFQRFGKVYGRLPISIGNLFFSKKAPLYVAIDASRKLISNFKRHYKEDYKINEKDAKWEENIQDIVDMKFNGIKSKEIILKSKHHPEHSDEFSINTQLNAKKDDLEYDYFHPYFFVNSKATDQTNLELLESKMGKMIHCSKITKNNTPIQILRSYYSFFNLVSNSKRFEISSLRYCSEDKGYPSNHSNFIAEKSGSIFLLEEYLFIFKTWWSVLKDLAKRNKISDADLKNMEELVYSKYYLWKANIESTPDGFETWLTFLETVLRKNLLDENTDEKITGLIENVIKSYKKENFNFFTMVEFYMKILKKRLSTKNDQQIKGVGNDQ